MVNVEADVLCGKYLSDLAEENNVICSMAYGDQPSLILEQIEWAKLNGFEVVCAGKVNPLSGHFKSVALQTAHISIADLSPHKKLLNIFGFMPDSFSALSLVKP